MFVKSSTTIIIAELAEREREDWMFGAGETCELDLLLVIMMVLVMMLYVLISLGHHLGLK